MKMEMTKKLLDFWLLVKQLAPAVHGANRLGANSLLDLVVFGRAAAETTQK
jgi:succinate dehydrogenase/fumarate reductase flavoprotein subunit